MEHQWGRRGSTSSKPQKQVSSGNMLVFTFIFSDDAGEDKDAMEKRVLALSVEQEEEEVLQPAEEEEDGEMLKMATAMSLEQEEGEKPSPLKGERLRNAKQKG